MTTRKPDEWMPLDVRKYLGDTMHLGREQHGAYLLLLMAYWMRGGALNDNDAELAAIARSSVSDWRRLRPILSQFFQIENGKWTQKRAEEELARARKFIERKSQAGKQGAEKRWRTNGEPNGTAMADPLADGMANQCLEDAPLPLPSTNKKKERIIAHSAHASFPDFWTACPKKVGKKKAVKAYNKALQETSPEVLIAAMARYGASQVGKDQNYTAHPATWLNDGRWADEAAVVATTGFVPANLAEIQRLEEEARNRTESENVH